MFNPIKRIKDIIELVRTPPGEPEYAIEITFENQDEVIEQIGIENEKYAKVGAFMLVYPSDLITVCPSKDFVKHFEFTETPDVRRLTPVRTIKPL